MTKYTVFPGDDIHVAELPPEPVLPPAHKITAYSQTDERWADAEFWPGYTFRRYGCLICAYAMIASQVYSDAGAFPSTFATALIAEGAINNGLVNKPSRIPGACPQLSWHGAIHWRDEAADMDFLARELREFGPTVIEVAYNPAKPVLPNNQHFLVLTATLGPDAQVIDPIDGNTKPLCSSRYLLDEWGLKGLGAERIITGCRLLRVKAGD